MKKTTFWLFLIFVFSSAIQAEDLAFVQFIKGKVIAIKDGNKRKLKKNDIITEGETIKTNDESHLVIFFKGSEIHVMPESSLVLKSLPEKNKKSSMELLKGFSWFKLVNLGKGSFDVATPVSIAGVRGTSFSVIYEEDEKRAMNCICHGSVKVSPANGKAELIKAGNGSVISEDLKLHKINYKGLILKKESLPAFAKELEAAPILKNCLSCHIPKGWTPKKEEQPSFDYPM